MKQNGKNNQLYIGASFGGLKSAVVFTPWKSANATDQGFLFLSILPVHYWK